MKTPSQKDKLIEILSRIDPAETPKLDALKTKEIIETFSKEEHNAGEMVKEVSAAVTRTMARYHEALLQGIQEAFSQHSDIMGKYIKALETSVREGHPKDFSGFFKDIGNKIVEGNMHSKDTRDLIKNLKWNSSMQIRSRTTGAPLDPHAIAPSISIGNGSVTTSGTAVQLSPTSISCTRVIVCNNDANSSLTNYGTIVVGDSTVVAASATRKGHVIYAGNYAEFYVSDLSLLWVDATDNGAKYHFYVEKFS